MEMLERIIEVHPNADRIDPEITGLIAELVSCEVTCVACADACLSERDVTMLAHCISLNADCADACETTARMAARVGHQDAGLLRMQLEACRESCRLCAAECERHEHEHCRVCAQSCRMCERACTDALDRMMASV